MPTRSRTSQPSAFISTQLKRSTHFKPRTHFSKHTASLYRNTSRKRPWKNSPNGILLDPRRRRTKLPQIPSNLAALLHRLGPPRGLHHSRSIPSRRRPTRATRIRARCTRKAALRRSQPDALHQRQQPERDVFRDEEHVRDVCVWR
jgi:hypothetical protein